MNDETTLTEKESIEIISRMIQNAKISIGDDGIFYLLWGCTIFLGAIGQFILIQNNVTNGALVWPILMVIAGIVSVVIGSRRSRKAKVKTFVEEFIQYLWIGFGISLFIVLFFSSQNKMPWQIAYPMIMVLYGLGTFVSGGALRFFPLKIGAFVCWGCSVVAFFLPFEYQLLIIALAVLSAFIIPGYLLRSRYNREVNEAI